MIVDTNSVKISNKEIKRMYWYNAMLIIGNTDRNEN
jgi:hypothetical protein